MRGFWAVYFKELHIIFVSPIFYAVALMFAVIAGYFFYSTAAYYALMSMQSMQNPMLAGQLSMREMVFRPFFVDLSIVLLLVSPLITMRVYAEERRSGTIELMLTSPLTDRTTLLAKYGSVMTVFGILLLLTVPNVAMLAAFGDPNWKPILSQYLGLFLLGSSFMSLGVFASSLTQNQIVAGVLAFGALLLFWIIGWAETIAGGALGPLFGYLSIIEHFDGFAKGVIDSRDLVYYVIFTLLFLFLTLRQIESFRWRG